MTWWLILYLTEDLAFADLIIKLDKQKRIFKRIGRISSEKVHFVSKDRNAQFTKSLSLIFMIFTIIKLSIVC